ncbi:MAG: hypothetical protein H6840_08040 [Planctomycetes bacterium]|nr:hypothetical protein [Planctomycetota bacterium]
MRLAERLNSFPVIAVAALLLAGLFGFLIGFGTTGKAAPTIRQATLDTNSPAAVGRGGPLEGSSLTPRERGDTPRPDGNGGRSSSPRNGGTGSTSSNPGAGSGNSGTGTTSQPIKTGEPRKLPQGRVDPLVTAQQTQQAQAAIEVSVRDANGNPLPFALLALDVNSGPLGWQLVQKQPQAVPETRGVFRFSQLYAGEYRVRSLQTNYRRAEAVVQLLREDATENVSLVFEPLEYSQVEFFVRFEDGEAPDEVELRIQRPDQDDASSNGRFGKYADSGAGGVSRGMIPPTRYRQRTAGGGLVKLTLPVGQETQIDFAARKAEIDYQANASVTPTAGVTQKEVTLLPTEPGSEGEAMNGTVSPGKLAVTLTVDGKEASFTRVNLYKDVNDFQYRPPSTTEENKYVFQSIFAGSWFLVAESAGFHAPFVQAVDVGPETVLEIDIKTGHLRVNAAREPGTPDPSGGEARYRVRLRPMGSGTIERAYNGNLTGKQSDFIDFIVPAGPYDVRVESPENYAKLAVSPVEQSFSMTAGGEQALNFTLSAATTLKFQVVDANGQPIPNAEFLLTFHEAGAVPDSEKTSVEKAGHDGRCDVPIAPSGPVYLMIWTTSTDWNNPDKVLQLDLPAYGTKDLGAIVVQQ